MGFTFLAKVDDWGPGDPNEKASEISLNVALINLPAAVLSEKSKVQKSVYNT